MQSVELEQDGLEIKFTSSGNIFEAYCKIIAEE
jgi:hypothetical protein